MQIERGDFVADARQILRGGERSRLPFAQRFLPLFQIFFNFRQRHLLRLHRPAMSRERGLGPGQFFGDRRRFLLRRAVALLGLRDVRKRLRVLRRQFTEAFLVELNPAFVPVHFALQFQPALLLRGCLVLQFRKPPAELGDFIFKTQDVGGPVFNFVPQFFDGGLLPGNLRLQHVELMPRELRVEMLQLGLNLLVPARLAGLALERPDLPLHFADEIGHAQKILLRVFQLAKRFLFLALEFCDARGLLEDNPAVFRFAGKNLCDVALREDAVARPPDTRAHEQLLDVFEPARRAVEKIFAVAIAENPARERDFVVGDLDARRAQVFPAHAAERERHFAHAHRFAAVRAVENHVCHFAAAQRLGRLLAEHPADGIGDIGLAAAIGADDGGDTGLEVQRGFVREGLKAEKRQIFEIHALERA